MSKTAILIRKQNIIFDFRKIRDKIKPEHCAKCNAPAAFYSEVKSKINKPCPNIPYTVQVYRSRHKCLKGFPE